MECQGGRRQREESLRVEEMRDEFEEVKDEVVVTMMAMKEN